MPAIYNEDDKLKLKRDLRAPAPARHRADSAKWRARPVPRIHPRARDARAARRRPIIVDGERASDFSTRATRRPPRKLSRIEGAALAAASPREQTQEARKAPQKIARAPAQRFGIHANMRQSVPAHYHPCKTAAASSPWVPASASPRLNCTSPAMTRALQLASESTPAALRYSRSFHAAIARGAAASELEPSTGDARLAARRRAATSRRSTSVIPRLIRPRALHAGVGLGAGGVRVAQRRQRRTARQRSLRRPPRARRDGALAAAVREPRAN